MPAPQSRSSALGPDSVIPDKLYFKIGEVSTLVGVAPHVLRYWEREVAAIRPGKTASNQRRYRRKDVELFREIKRLLYEEKYTLAGARKRIANPGKHVIEPGDLQETGSDCAASRSTPMVRPPDDSGIQMKFGSQESQRVRLKALRKGLHEIIELCGGKA